MPSFSVLIHADDESPHLGRLLETLRPADEVLVVDHANSENTRKATREYGARLVPSVPGVDFGAYAVNCRNEWVLCLQTTEALSEALEASLFEWKKAEVAPVGSFSMAIREQEAGQWRQLQPETRLVNRCQVNWQGKLPPAIETATVLSGHLLRFLDTE